MQSPETRRRCGAKTRDGKPCNAWAVSGRERCRMHGGATPRGLAHPSTTHGAYSRALPPRILADFEAARTDPELLELRNQIGLVDARILDVLRRVDTGESGARWRELNAAWRAYRDAVKAKDPDAMATALGAVGQAIDAGEGDWRAWREVGSLVEQRRRLVETERRRLVDLRQLVTSEQLLLVSHALLKVVLEHVRDQGTREAIAVGFRGVLDRPGAGGPDDR